MSYDCAYQPNSSIRISPQTVPNKTLTSASSRLVSTKTRGTKKNPHPCVLSGKAVCSDRYNQALTREAYERAKAELRLQHGQQRPGQLQASTTRGQLQRLQTSIAYHTRAIANLGKFQHGLDDADTYTTGRFCVQRCVCF